MKKKIALENVKPGSTFTADVFVDEKNLLVPAGVIVKKRDLDALKKWGVTHVFTEGEQKAVLEPSKDDLLVVPEGFAGNKELFKRYSEMVQRLKILFSALKANEPVPPKAFDQISQILLQTVRDYRTSVVSAILSIDSKEYDLATASVNVAILSVIVGISLNLPPYKLAYLSTGALLHDAGMLRVPDSILSKKGGLTPDEEQKIKAHPLYSYKIATKELLYPDDIGVIGLQHHERWDSEGYPRQTTSSDIDVLARIVSVVDAFEAMVSEKPYRNSMIGYDAMKSLLSDNSKRFDPSILKAFIRSMGIYPIGSYVQLNNAAITRVVDVHADAPLRPKVKVIVDEFGKMTEGDQGDTIDLLTEKSMFIARAIDPKELLKR